MDESGSLQGKVSESVLSRLCSLPSLNCSASRMSSREL
jgi:hypothetical protein